MYDTEERIELVKKRMYEYHRRQERRTTNLMNILELFDDFGCETDIQVI